MSTTLNVAFVKQFEKEIHEAYQRLGSKLKGTVRQASNVKGSSTVFQKVGKGVASTKSTHAWEECHDTLITLKDHDAD